MELESRRNNLIQWLASLQDIKILQQIESLKARQDQTEDERFLDDFSEEQVKGLDEARLEMKIGGRLSFEQVRAKIRAKHGI